MVDICMCKNEKCVLKDSCYRYLAKAGLWQAYFVVDKPVQTCDEYWEVKDKEQVDRLNIVWSDDIYEY